MLGKMRGKHGEIKVFKVIENEHGELDVVWN